MIRNDEIAFHEAVESVARQLVTADHKGPGSYIKTPLLYPGGSSVVIQVSDSYPDFFVTDFGAGYNEAEMLGGSAIFTRYARQVAEQAGIGFDQHSFFIMRATRKQLAGAVVTVANCSQQAVAIAAYKLSEKKYSDETERLFTRLISVFPSRQVAKDVEVIGQSNTRWHVATLVKGDGHPTIFEPVSSHHTSIFAASTKFRDIAELEGAPRRVAIVRKKAELKTYLAVLSRAADVIEQDASDETFTRLAA